ncbi:MAG: FHA domain-containing protein [Ruminococcaceae bacterium]|nr:FHA domain-containing protein [Oscillospiraceae bacterium]
MLFSIFLPAEAAAERLSAAIAAHPEIYSLLSGLIRYALLLLGLFVVVGCGVSLLRGRHDRELWGYLSMPDGTRQAIEHWEIVIGRSRRSDIVVNFPSVSRSHAVLMRDSAGGWTVTDLRSKTGTTVNRVPVEGTVPVRQGDLLSIGGVQMVLMPIDREEEAEHRRGRRVPGFLVHPALNLLWLTEFQIFACVGLVIARCESFVWAIPGVFFGLMAVMWAWYLLFRAMKRRGFELDTLAFFLSTLGLMVTTSYSPAALSKQFFAMLLGLLVFIILGWILRDLDRVRRLRWPAAVGTVLLLAVTLVFGETKFGAKNWINIGGLSLQLSELAKVCFIFAGSATLERLFARRNMVLFIVLAGLCVMVLALQGDYGTALIFFVTFLVIAFLRSGDLASVAFIAAAAVFGGFLVIRAKPYIAGRFAAWGHVWEHSAGLGYQQTRTMAAAASGGLFGVGVGEGWLKRIGAASTDLVFGILCEELGLILALTAVAAVLIMAVFTRKSAVAARSAYYAIAACATAGMLVFQMALNVFGSLDILPLTGVTFPFVSTGGSSMVACWGLLAFLKAADTRQNASFVVRLDRKKGAHAK